MKQFELLTLFPGFFTSPLQTSLLGKALEKKLIAVQVHDIRHWATDRHRTADDLPYGGGPGMVMKSEPIVASLEAIQKTAMGKKSRRLYLSPKGRRLEQKQLKEYLAFDQLILLCGRYEGVDQRVIDHYIDEEVSIGDYVLAGGEVAALVFIEAVSRLIPGVIGREESLEEESFSEEGFLEYPHYTRPEEFRGHRVPEILLSGDHKKIAEWRQKMARELSRKKRPS